MVLFFIGEGRCYVCVLMIVGFDSGGGVGV